MLRNNAKMQFIPPIKFDLFYVIGLFSETF